MLVVPRSRNNKIVTKDSKHWTSGFNKLALDHRSSWSSLLQSLEMNPHWHKGKKELNSSLVRCSQISRRDLWMYLGDGICYLI